jgi:hypothetical protein
LVKKDNSNSIKIGCTTPQDNLTSCFYNHNELDLSNGFFREEEVFAPRVVIWHFCGCYPPKAGQLASLLTSHGYSKSKKAIRRQRNLGPTNEMIE